MAARRLPGTDSSTCGTTVRRCASTGARRCSTRTPLANSPHRNGKASRVCRSLLLAASCASAGLAAKASRSITSRSAFRRPAQRRRERLQPDPRRPLPHVEESVSGSRRAAMAARALAAAFQRGCARLGAGSGRRYAFSDYGGRARTDPRVARVAALALGAACTLFLVLRTASCSVCPAQTCRSARTACSR